MNIADEYIADLGPLIKEHHHWKIIPRHFTIRLNPVERINYIFKQNWIPNTQKDLSITM